MSTYRLYPTRTRLRLLLAIERGQVRKEGERAYDRGDGDRNVSARVLQLVAAGWVTVGEEIDSASRHLYALTAEGRAVLAPITPAGRQFLSGSAG